MRDGAAGAIRRGHIAIGNRRLYLDCRGQTGPTVLIDVGLGFKPGTEQWGWFPIRDAVLPHARVCLYDRAGQGQSDPPPTPLTIGDYVQDLHRLLHAAALPAPYLLVGGSIGGLIVWLYGARYPQEVGGLVLVDSAHPQQWQRMLDLVSNSGDAESPAVAAFRRSEIDAVIDPARNEEHMNLPDCVARRIRLHRAGHARCASTRPALPCRRRVALPARPQAAHLHTGCEQLVQAALRLDPSIFQHDDRIGTSQRRSPVGHNQTDHAAVPRRACEEPIPERLLGLDVERARQIVEDQQLRVPDKHACRRRAMGLPTREAHASRADARLEPQRHACQIVLQDGEMECPRQVDLLLG